jgi:hypothetical protein
MHSIGARPPPQFPPKPEHHERITRIAAELGIALEPELPICRDTQGAQVYSVRLIDPNSTTYHIQIPILACDSDEVVRGALRPWSAEYLPVWRAADELAMLQECRRQNEAYRLRKACGEKPRLVDPDDLPDMPEPRWMAAMKRR